MYQEDFHLSNYWQFSPKQPLQHTENGQSLQFPPIHKLDLIYQMTSANDVEPRLPRRDWLIERSVWVQSSSTQVNFAEE